LERKTAIFVGRTGKGSGDGEVVGVEIMVR